MDRQIQDQSNASMPRAPTSSGRSTELSAARTRYSAPDSSSETFVPPIRVILPTPPRTLAPPEVQLRSLTTPLSSVYSPASTSVSHKRPRPYLSPPSTSRKTRGPQLGSDPASPSTPKKPHKPLSSTSSGKRNRTYWQERNDGIELQRNVLPKHKQEESVPKLLAFAAQHIAELKKREEDIRQERDLLQGTVGDMEAEVMMLERFRSAKMKMKEEGS